MQSNQQVKYYSEADYLEGEQQSAVKHEFVDGDVFLMAGASKNHERLAGNIYRKFGNHLENSHCEPFASDMKVRTPNGNFRYPDCMVVCDDTSDDQFYSETPIILVEVISRSTRQNDEQTKRLEYMNIASLVEYVLIEQDYVDITVFNRNQNWLPTHYFLGDSVHFESIDLTLSVEEIYHRVVNQDMNEWLETKNAS
jgi:Uma2 family endonuclease